MATDTAPAPRATGRPPRRHYWQLPTFALGVAAAAAAVVRFPPPPTDPATLAGRDLLALREQLSKRPADTAAVAELVRKVADAAERSPNPDTGRFLAATGYEVLAEYGPAADADANWAAAARLFAATDPARLPDPADPKRLAYRQAKADAATGRGDPKVLFPALKVPPPGLKEDEGGERPRLLAETALKLNPPLLNEAKAGLTDYLGSPSRLPPAALARLKLALVDVHMKLNEPNKARDWLNLIGTTAGPDVQAAAKVQLAHLAAADGNWSDAVKNYDAALAVSNGLPDADRGLVRYQAGVGYSRLKNTTAAARAFEQALTPPGPAATAAAVRLAELTLRDPAAADRCAASVGLLERAVHGISTPADYANKLVTVHEVQAAFEEAIQSCVQQPDFAAAARAVAAYGKVAAPGRDREQRAEVNAAWATALGGNPATAADAAAKFRAAAADFAAMAEATPEPAGKADLFRKAADCAGRGGDRAAAVAAVDRVIQVPGAPAAQVSAAWLDKGGMLLADGQAAEAEQAFRTAMAGPGPAAAAARVKLAMTHVDRARAKVRGGGPNAAAEARKELDLGQALLAQAANKTADGPGERDSQQQALYELGKLLLLQYQNYADAEARFRQLIQLNPTGPLAGSARLYLGSCLLLVARGDNQGGRPPADAERKLTEARDLFQTLADHPDPFLRTQADIRLANTTLLLKRYDEMPPLCEKLAAKYRGKVEELIVLSMMYSSQRFADRTADAARTLVRMEEVFGKLQDADFPGGAEEYTRGYWKTQWFDALRTAADVR